MSRNKYEIVQEDFTLESILESKDDRYTNFIIYLQHTYCLENLYFWQDVQDYKSEPTLDKYNAILQTYVITNSPYEINIPCDMREALLAHFSPDCFDDAAETILELIRINSFLPWHSSFYHALPSPPHHRNSFMAPSMSFHDRWNISRPSFSSLRAPSSFSTTSSSYRSKISHLFQRQKNTFVFKLKKSNGFSWLAKK